MARINWYFEVGEQVKVRGKNYLVEGTIRFVDQRNGESWAEYKLKEMNSRSICWLSIDTINKEYALYTEEPRGSRMDEQQIRQYGYKQVDSGSARVTNHKGRVDVDNGDIVHYKEYEDASEEKIIAIERWEDETEYSRGYYLDSEEIQKVAGNREGKSSTSSYRGNKSPLSICCLVIFFVLVFGWMGLSANTHSIKKQIEKDSRFTYVSSMTADLKNSKKANVYSTELSVEQTAKIILDFAATDVTNVDENEEDGTVAVLTKREYCLIYTSEDNQTLVQISSRDYPYYSRVNPYRSRTYSSLFYRRFYYSTGYIEDKKRFGGVSSYEDYIEAPIDINSSNRYKQYSDTIKQESIAARLSSGGGTGVGK